MIQPTREYYLDETNSVELPKTLWQETLRKSLDVFAVIFLIVGVIISLIGIKDSYDFYLNSKEEKISNLCLNSKETKDMSKENERVKINDSNGSPTLVKKPAPKPKINPQPVKKK